ncbi:MAG: peptide chain release factor N(5)-glutamine methyltransferase [Bacillota bacterium]
MGELEQIQKALGWAREYLRGCGVEGAALDAEVLLAHVTGLDRAGLYRESGRALSPREAEAYRRLVERRGRREPVAYLTGKKEFMGLEFLVGPAVLIPRPETELLVEKACALAREFVSRPRELVDPERGPGVQELLIADAGTGSGAIAVSLAVFLPAARIYATDCSSAALAVARENARRHGVAGRISFLQGDLLSPLFALNLAGRLVLIVANLPYIPAAELPGLMPDVRCYEPLSALDGGPDGLAHYRRLLPQARRCLSDGGRLLMEIGPGQGEKVGRLLAENNWHYQIIPDLAGRERVVLADF